MAHGLNQRLAYGLPLGLGPETGTEVTFAMIVRSYRKSQGWTQAGMAEQWNYSFETISAWERGKRSPAVPEIPRVAQLLGMDVKELAGVVRDRRRPQSEMKEQAQGEATHQEAADEPFAQGRLLWTLHLGVERGRLQCIVACPLASGEVWEVPFDPVRDGEAIRQVYQVIHEQVGKVAGGFQAQAGGDA